MAQAVKADPIDSGQILRQMAQPTAAVSTPFVELRESELLDAPLKISGEYRRLEGNSLVREVRSPYAETTTLKDGRATVERAGRSPRSFSLARAPELAGLQDTFGALLAGDREVLEENFAVGAWGAVDGWTMTMAPRDRALARRVQGITLFGANDELRCIETLGTDDSLQRTLLGSAAVAAAEVDTAEGFERLCRSGASD
ncbi:LolA-related protein [Luteimonas sp. A277]